MMLSELLKICDILNEFGVEYALIGGVAAYLLGVQRTTLDVDILINVRSEHDLVKIAYELADLDYDVNIEEVKKAFRLKQNFIVPLFSGVMVDFKVAKTDLDRKTLERRMKVFIEDVVIYLAPLEELIAVKIREQGTLEDIEDAIQLMYIYSDIIDWKYLAELVGKDPLIYIEQLIDFVSKKYPVKSLRRALTGMKRLKRRLRKVIREYTSSS